MLLRSQAVEIASRLSPDALLEQLQGRAREYDEFNRSPAAWAAGVVGWVVRLRAGRVVVQARVAGQAGFLPEFVGDVAPTATGSLLKGVVRLPRFVRGFLLLWIASVIAATVLTSIQPHSHGAIILFLAGAMTCPFAGALFAGAWRVSRADGGLGPATIELLNQASERSELPL